MDQEASPYTSPIQRPPFHSLGDGKAEMGSYLLKVTQAATGTRSPPICPQAHVSIVTCYCGGRGLERLLCPPSQPCLLHMTSPELGAEHSAWAREIPPSPDTQHNHIHVGTHTQCSGNPALPVPGPVMTTVGLLGRGHHSGQERGSWSQGDGCVHMFCPV